jgi:broad specificity phosphatase PhoE
MLDCAALPQGFSLRLVLVRHGEPEEAAKGRCYGRFDFGLSEAGRDQVQATLNSVKNLAASALYASPLRRAAESASIAGRHLRLEATISHELQEIDCGCFEGLSYEQIEESFPREFRSWMECPAEFRFPGGESLAEMKQRVLGFRHLLLNRHAGQTVVLVSHAGPNRVLVAEALGVPDALLFRIDQRYAALNVIDYFPGSSVVRLMNG